MVLQTALCAVLIVNIVKLLYKRHQLVTIIDKIPGPKAYPILGNLLDLIDVSREGKGAFKYYAIFLAEIVSSKSSPGIV